MKPIYKDKGKNRKNANYLRVIVKENIIIIYDAEAGRGKAYNESHIITHLIHLLRDYDYSNATNPYSGACYAQGFVYTNKYVIKNNLNFKETLF